MVIVLVYAVEILLAILLKSSVFIHFSFGTGIVPDLLVMVVVAAAYQMGKTKGMIVGFFAGLMLDITTGGLLGVYALFYMFIGYLNGFMANFYVQNDILLPVVMAAGSEFIFMFLCYVFKLLTKGRLNIGSYVLHQMIPAALYTAVVFIIVYRLFDLIYWKITKPVFTDYSKVES